MGDEFGGEADGIGDGEFEEAGAVEIDGGLDAVSGVGADGHADGIDEDGGRGIGDAVDGIGAEDVGPVEAGVAHLVFDFDIDEGIVIVAQDGVGNDAQFEVFAGMGILGERPFAEGVDGIGDEGDILQEDLIAAGGGGQG